MYGGFRHFLGVSFCKEPFHIEVGVSSNLFKVSHDMTAGISGKATTANRDLLLS